MFTPDSLAVVAKYCFVAGTNVTLEHSSIPIEKLIKYKNTNVLSWDKKVNGLVYSKNIKFFDNGEHECIELTFEDGTILQCTPDHKILTSRNEWIEASNLVLNNDLVKFGVKNPSYDFEEDFEKCKNWKNENFNIETFDEYKKIIIISRLIGLLITDGHLSKERAILYTGHKLDANKILNDIEEVFNVRQNICKQKFCLSINLPREFSKKLLKIDGLVIGKKIDQNITFPSFILDKNCPFLFFILLFVFLSIAILYFKE